MELPRKRFIVLRRCYRYQKNELRVNAPVAAVEKRVGDDAPRSDRQPIATENPNFIPEDVQERAFITIQKCRLCLRWGTTDQIHPRIHRISLVPNVPPITSSPKKGHAAGKRRPWRARNFVSNVREKLFLCKSPALKSDQSAHLYEMVIAQAFNPRSILCWRVGGLKDT